MSHTMPDPFEVMPVPLPSWKDLIYGQLDLFYEQFIYTQITRMADKEFTTAALDTFMLNAKAAAERLNTIRLRVEAEP